MKSYIPLILFAAGFVAACGKPNPDEYMAKAKAAVDSSNFVLAIEECNKLINDHPSSPEAEEAMYMIASIRNDAMHDFPHAIEAYTRYLTTYPKGPKAPLALFMTGYVYNNDMHDYVAAKAAYEQFLSTYPDHEMAASARFELENLGKKPEELLPAVQENIPPAAASNSKPTAKKK